MTGMRAWALPEFPVDGDDVAYEPEWRAEPDGSAATVAAGRWAGELVSPFAVRTPAAEPAEAEPDWQGEETSSGPFSVDGELLAWAAELVQVPQQVRDAFGRQTAGQAVGLLVGCGVRDEEWLTNLVFHARHRELGGTPVGAGEPALAAEWEAIRDSEVRPRLATDATVVDQLEGEELGNLIGDAVRDGLARNAVRTALAGGEQRENELTDIGFRAAQFGAGGKIKADDPRFAELSARWLRIRDRIVRPLLREKKAGLDRLTPRAKPHGRPCCAIFLPMLLDLSNLGSHGTVPDALGEVYTRKLGFIDMGHARETADVVLWALTQLRQDASTGTDIELFHGSAKLLRDIPIERRLALAQQLTYVDSVEHEIVTKGTSQDFSSFSPEDLPSNLFGTLVAVAAFRADGGSDPAITQQFKQKLTAAGAQTVAVAQQVQIAAEHRGWWSGGSLLKRNLTAVPWLIDEHGNARIAHGALPAAPSLVSPDFEYTSRHTGIKNTEFATKLAGIRAALPASAVTP
jgi:hypothetical protein